MAQNDQGRYLAWDACYNAREVGGYPTANGGQTRWQALVRADNLYRLTPEGQAALRDYGIATVIDLRNSSELETHRSPFATETGADDGTLRYLNLPLHDVDSQPEIDAAPTVQEVYILILEKNKDRVTAIIKAVAEGLERGPVLIHCHGGKDRTGIIVALLLTVAGVPRDTITEDYAVSEARLEPSYAEWVEEKSREQGTPVERPQWMFSRPETMAGVLDYLDHEYGSVEGYLRSAGVTRDDIAKIREYLLEPVSTA